MAKCIWKQEDKFDDDRIYNTACGKTFFFGDGGPKENEMKFCCYCGKVIKESPDGKD